MTKGLHHNLKNYMGLSQQQIEYFCTPKIIWECQKYSDLLLHKLGLNDYQKQDEAQNQKNGHWDFNELLKMWQKQSSSSTATVIQQLHKIKHNRNILTHPQTPYSPPKKSKNHSKKLKIEEIITLLQKISDSNEWSIDNNNNNNNNNNNDNNEQ